MSVLAKLVNVVPKDNYVLWLQYEDGTEGDVDLSDLAGQGVFALWHKGNSFNHVYIGEYGQLVWNDDVELCADALYLKLSQQTLNKATQYHPRLQAHQKIYK
jgi:hypothetical protein